jgi:hypothetical protein
MRKLRYPLGILAATLAIFGASTPTASAALGVVHVYHGNRAHGWTNTDHTRVGIEDTRADGLVVRLDVMAGNIWYVGWVDDPDGTGPQHGAKYAPAGLQKIRACATGTGCTEANV